MFFLLLVLFVNKNACAQEILYVLPDKVEKALDKHISAMLKNKGQKVYLTLNNSDDGYSITVSNYLDNENKVPIEWIKCTTRYALVNESKYPILLDTDYMFGVPDPKAIGMFGKREGWVRRVLVINEGFVIKFNKKGEIIN